MAKKKQTRKRDPNELELGPPEEMMTDLDPHLQDMILAEKESSDVDSAVAGLAENGELMVDVIAKLKDPDLEVEGLNIARKIGQIVTGAIAASAIESIRSNDNVISLKRATRLHEELDFSVPEINGTQAIISAELPDCADPINGAGVIVGVVDFGGDFAHGDFLNADGTTRMLALWDQRGGRTSQSPNGFDYGREFTIAQIDSALRANDPYQTLGYDPGRGQQNRGSHGTHVLSIAAGNGRSTGRPGVAPNADIIFVHVAAGDYEDDDSFGNSRRLLEAVDYIFSKAAELQRSAVVNLSLGTHGGPHDGSTLAEQGFDELLRTSGRAIAISAGNSHGRRSHASGTLVPNARLALDWLIRSTDQTDNEIEVWYEGSDTLEVTLITPSGQRLGPVNLGETTTLRSGGRMVGRIIHRRGDPNNGDNQIDILLDRSLFGGNWEVELHNVSSSNVGFHSWIERDDRGQSQFAIQDNDQSHTIGSISCGELTLAVGSYEATSSSRDLSSFTSEGPTRDGKEKPEISAPGHNIMAAQSRTQGSTRKSGTSMASPHVAGLIALLMQASNSLLSIAEIRNTLITTARSNPPGGSGWHPRYGNGRIDALATILTQFPGATTSQPTPGAVAQLPVAGNGTVTIQDLIKSMAAGVDGSGAKVRIQLEVEMPSN